MTDDVLTDDYIPKFGPCCMCETTEGVHNLVMLDRRAALPSHGWGCVVCDLPMDGAYAVLCDKCLTRWQREPAALTTACRGYPRTDGRVAIADLPPGEFKHNGAKHAFDLNDGAGPCDDCADVGRCGDLGRCFMEPLHG